MVRGELKQGYRMSGAVAAWLLSLICATGLGFWAAPLGAQAPAARSSAPVATDEFGYKFMVPSSRLTGNKGEENKYRSLVQQVLTGKAALDENRVRFDSYYTWFTFPLMTQTTPEALRELPERRNKFFRTEVEISTNPQAHAHLVDLTLTQMSAIVGDTFHPAVRYNAMLIISSLNDQEVVRFGADKRVPEPMARALPIILAEFKKAENSDAIKVAALIGLSRHLEWDPFRAEGSPPIPAALRTEIVNELLALAQAKDPPAGRNADGHLWFRRRAIEALGFACYSKLDSPVADAFDQLLRDGSEPLSLRCSVASALGRMNFQAPAKLDTVGTVKELGYLALVACDAELNRVKNLKETETERAARLSGQVQGSSGGGEGYDPMGAGPMGPGSAGGLPSPGVAGPGSAGGAGAGFNDYGGSGVAGPGVNTLLVDPKGYRYDVARRRIRQQLYCVQFALTGGEDFVPGKPPVAATPGLENVAKMPPRGMNAYAKPGDEKKYVSDVYDKVRKLAEVCESKAVDMASLDKELRKTMKTLESITKKLAPPAPPPGAETPAGPAIAKTPDAGAAALPEAAPKAPAAAPGSPAPGPAPAPVPPPAPAPAGAAPPPAPAPAAP